ncbi:hypothetical protein [Methylobacterium thuringiense]|uniref:Uncharacterized protein n=1 Tax=Methylobacterium thuringiense TaxID=1003091 RepID=A0ABQ4TS88_9HYPH|nr:hypothetical protein [Methylobacterium thuringiense]GJE57759.1 hypothetical protein EKPJFOCH_4277 [Methylobacterium thuringiense]
MAIPLLDGTAGTRSPVKPAHGSPRNGCGYCCSTQACLVAPDWLPDHPKEGGCLALEYAAGRFVCGMIRRPSHYMPDLPNDWADGVLSDMIATALGAGRGCDADDL